MKKAILGLSIGLFLLGLGAGGSGAHQLHDEIHAVYKQWLAIEASPPDQATVVQAHALWLHTHHLEMRYADNPQVKAWENRAWNTYQDYLRQSSQAS